MSRTIIIKNKYEAGQVLEGLIHQLNVNEEGATAKYGEFILRMLEQLKYDDTNDYFLKARYQSIFQRAEAIILRDLKWKAGESDKPCDPDVE